MGSLDPEVAQSLAKAFKEGIRLLPKILEALPDLLKEFDKDLTKEATERVDKKLEEEKKKMEEEEQKKKEKPEEPKPEEKLKVQGDVIPQGEVKQGPSITNNGNIEVPEA
jgi:Skp family chaperone for outer membrane proteins